MDMRMTIEQPAVAARSHPTGAPPIAFESPADAARYRGLTAQIQHHRGVIATLEHERQEILRRATWSLVDIMDREG